jgi:hypothetical protein
MAIPHIKRSAVRDDGSTALVYDAFGVFGTVLPGNIGVFTRKLPKCGADIANCLAGVVHDPSAETSVLGMGIHGHTFSSACEVGLQ